MPQLTDAHAPVQSRLRLDPVRSPDTQLDGCWWPASTDPGTELPALVRALERARGPVTRVLLSAAGWTRRPHNVDGARTVSIGYFSDQPTTLLTANFAAGDCVALQVVPPPHAGRG